MRRRAVILAAVVFALLVVDLTRAGDRQLTARAAIAGIHLYQATLSRAFAASGVACRFTPTCSHYAEACVRRYGLLRGGGLALARVLRCGPWTPAGTIDPAPTG
jgi:putative membrane protein insertion efficiency factor